MQRLYQRFAPSKAIKRSHIATPTNPNPPRLVYGWAFERSWLMDYAAHNKLAVDCRPYARSVVGKDYLVYGQLTKEEEENKDVM